MNNRPRHRRSRRTKRRAFSLLEVVLAVALGAIVVYLVAGGIEFHLRQLTVRKSRIEESQLARAVLRRIADDLRAAVVDRPIDFSGVAQLTGSSGSGGSSGGSGGSGATGSGGGSGGGNSSTGGNSSSTGGSGNSSQQQASSQASGGLSSASNLINSSLLPETPGVYGNAYELQVDISRIPRYEEYAMVAQNNDLQGIRVLSDVKTVSYFLVGSMGLGSMGMGSGSMPGTGFASSGGRMGSGGLNSSGGLGLNGNANQYAMLGLPPDQPLQGLGRRIVDRAATRYAMTNADTSFLDQQTELFAPEVTFIQFRYFDGLQWLYQWDSEELGGIPLAIEIVLALQPPLENPAPNGSRTATTSSSMDATWQFDPDHVYRLVVNLPAAEYIDPAAESEDVNSSSANQGASR